MRQRGVIVDIPTEYRSFCGPLAVIITTRNSILRSKAAETLELYNVVWDRPHLPVRINLRETDSPARMLAGSFLTCRRMHVDITDTGLRATCESGACGWFSSHDNQWEISVPTPERGGLVDVEDLLGLVLTTGWRCRGWVPVHGGAVARGDCCALLCAPSGGGKSTLIAAMLHQGWQTLGDDKLLLTLDKDRRPKTAALLHNLNLHPQTRQWFPEVGDLELLPVYSAWTPKRKVSIEEIWPDQTRFSARPTHLVQIQRCENLVGFEVSSISPNDVLSILLRQTVIPQERNTARQILSTIAMTARQLQVLRIKVGEEAYSNSEGLAVLESALL